MQERTRSLKGQQDVGVRCDRFLRIGTQQIGVGACPAIFEFDIATRRPERPPERFDNEWLKKAGRQ